MVTADARYKEWVLTEAEQQKFHNWISNLSHVGSKDVRNDRVNWTPITKPLSESVVSLFTTGGVHRKSDQPFDIASPHGDWTFREIPTNIDVADLMVTHSHYSHIDADRDVNCMLPLERLRELSDQGVIGGIASSVFSIMGFNPDPKNLMEKTAPELARRYEEIGADLVFMTCG